MQLNRIEIDCTSGYIHLRYIESLFDAAGNEVAGGYHRSVIAAGDIDALTKALGATNAAHVAAACWQNLAPPIEE